MSESCRSGCGRSNVGRDIGRSQEIAAHTLTQLSRPEELLRAKERLDRCFAGYIDATINVDEIVRHCRILQVSLFFKRSEADRPIDGDYMAFPSNHDI